MSKSRLAATILITNIYWYEVCKLRNSKKARVCQVGGASAAECDTINLGCLLQRFPDIKEPVYNCPRSKETVSHLAARSEKILDLSGLFIDSFSSNHKSCAVGPRLALLAKMVLERVKGLDLGSL